MKRRGREPMSTDEHRRIPKYPIGVVAKLVGIPPQTLRRYEEAGLLDPARLDGKNRLYSDENLAVLEEIAELADLGINVVGIRYILHMREEVVQLRQEVRRTRTLLVASQTAQGHQPEQKDEDIR